MRKKIISSITISSFIVFFVLFLFISENIKKDYNKFEHRRSEERYKMIKNEFKSLSDNLKTLTSDWGEWDDTYEFVKNKNKKYIKSNLSPESIATLGVNYLYITDSDGENVYSVGYDQQKEGGVIPPEKLLIDLLQFDDLAGMYVSNENKIMIFSSAPITDSEGLKGSIGKIIMAYEFKLSDLNKKLGTQLEFLDIKPTEENTFEVNISKDKVNNKFYIPSVSNKGLVLKDSLDADILVLGKDSIKKYIWVLVINLIILILIISVGIEKLILARLRKIEITVEEIIEKKDLSRRLEVTGNDEISLLKKNINIFLETIENMNNKLIGKASYDVMTGIFNRHTGIEKLNFMIQESKFKNEPLTGCFVDIDGLKFVNDNFSHNDGDDLIKSIASILKSFSREEDLLFRLGGDEFFMAFLGPDHSDTEKIFSRISLYLEEYNKNSQKPYDLKISYGIIDYVYNQSIEEFIDSADTEMYKHKSEKKCLRS